MLAGLRSAQPRVHRNDRPSPAFIPAFSLPIDFDFPFAAGLHSLWTSRIGKQRRASRREGAMKSRLFQWVVNSAAAAVLIVALGCAQMPAGPASTTVGQSSLRATSTQHWNDYARELVARNPSA